jgi:hypothetical protein
MHKPALDIDALLAFHRETFGDARMDAASDEADREAEEAAAAATLAAEGDEGDEPDDGDKPDEGEESLGDKGKQALDRMKAKLKAEREKRAAAEAKLAAAAKPKDGDDDVDAIRKEADRAATARANERIVRSEVKAAATGKLADPADAFRFLDLSKFEVDDDGNVDEDELAEAIAELVKSKPYLGVTQGDGKRFKGTADGGVRGKPAAGKQQLTEADVKRLAAQGKHAEIEQARVDGRLNDLLGITTSAT